jgi:hypothetical protein
MMYRDETEIRTVEICSGILGDVFAEVLPFRHTCTRGTFRFQDFSRTFCFFCFCLSYFCVSRSSNSVVSKELGGRAS